MTGAPSPSTRALRALAQHTLTCHPAGPPLLGFGTHCCCFLPAITAIPIRRWAVLPLELGCGLEKGLGPERCAERPTQRLLPDSVAAMGLTGQIDRSRHKARLVTERARAKLVATEVVAADTEVASFIWALAGQIYTR